MIDKRAKRFGWWWRNPVEALRGAFPDTSEKAIRNVVWPHLQRAALNYELASRHNGRRNYLLRKRFDHLTKAQMLELAMRWPRKPRPLLPLSILRYADSAGVVGATASVEQRVQIENDHAQRTGWTAPRYFTINLKECRDRAIVEAFRNYVAAQRELLKIDPPKMNKGRANRSKRGLSPHKIEGLDVWTHDVGRTGTMQLRLVQRAAKRNVCSKSGLTGLSIF